MRSISLPINLLVIIILASIVLFSILIFFYGNISKIFPTIFRFSNETSSKISEANKELSESCLLITPSKAEKYCLKKAHLACSDPLNININCNIKSSYVECSIVYYCKEGDTYKEKKTHIKCSCNEIASS